MDGDWPVKLFRNLNCLMCNSKYFIRGFNLRGSRCPLLLQCGHSVCSFCIRHHVKTSNIISCPQCRITYPIDPDSLHDHFSVNLYLMGVLAMFQSERQERDRKLAVLTQGDGNFTYKVQGKLSNSDKKKGILCDECTKMAYWSCETCKCHFCESCWSKVHGAAKSLMKHVKLPTVAHSSKVEYGKCLSHGMQDLDLFCKSCKKAVCSHCVIQSHQGGQHSLITLQEQALEMMSIFKSVVEDAEMIQKRMKQTLQKVKSTQDSVETSDSQPWSNLRSEIVRKFTRLHGIIQLQEEKCLKQLHDKANEKKDVLSDLCEQLEAQIQKTVSLLDKYQNSLKKHQVHDLNLLYDQLAEVKTFPCYLISQKFDKANPSITFNDSLLKLVESYCTVDIPPREIFELRSGTNLPEGFAVEPLPNSNNNQRVSARTASSSNSDTVSACSSRDLHDGSGKFQSNSTKKSSGFTEGQKYAVHITYINNPGEFYITLNSQRKVKENIEKRAESSTYPFVSSGVSKDDLYMVKHRTDDKWCRGRVIEVLSENNADETRALVHFIDYGNSDTVSTALMKPLSPDLYDEPPLAVKCRLFNCVPKDGKWTSDSAKTMEKIVNGDRAILFVMKIQPDCLEVDLSISYSEGQIGRDIVSVRDALIFLECASFVGGPVTHENPAVEKYDEQYLPALGERHDVIVTHVNSPDEFYLHRTEEDASFLCDLGTELDNYYEENSQRGIIYSPKIGMACAAKFSEDKKWYRAIIEGLPGNKMVTVFYVDYGNKETISWMDIRKLRENFVKRPPLAICCSLAKIQPKIPGNWNSKAKDYLIDCAFTCGISMHVEGTHVSEPKLKVLLYKEDEGKNVCVNFLFIDMGFTSTFISQSKESSSGAFARDFHKPSNQNEGEESKDTWHTTKRHKLSAKELRENYELEKQKQKEAQPTEDESDSNESNGFKDSNIRVKVEVLSAESPSCIYVSFSKGNEDFRNLQKKLCEFYYNTLPLEDKEWPVNSKCAVYNPENENWCRASIIKVFADGTMKVFLKDFATEIIVDSSTLRELDPLFVRYGPRAVKCHLSNVAPPGDTWPGISCEYLASELERHRDVYMSKMGEIENNSLPIELWIQQVIPGGALEPTIIEWVTLNKLLVDKGLAVPKENLYYLSVATAEERVPSNEKLLSNEKLFPNEKEPSNEKETSSEKETKSVWEKRKAIIQSSSVLPPLNCKWKPPEPLKKSRFTCIPTYVDLNAIIYIQDIEDQEKLAKIRDSLQQEYENSKPSAEDYFWSPGEICIAKYFADKEWYRGLVLEVNSIGSYQVLFVDYGNIETCQVADLRKRVKMLEIPILVHKFKLHDLASKTADGKWPVAVIDVIHSLVVDKKCEVIILPSQGNDPYFGLLNIIENKQDVASVLLQENFAAHELIGSDSSLSSDDTNFSTESEKEMKFGLEASCSQADYVPLDIPEDCKKLHILIKALESENEFYGHVVGDEFAPLDLKKALEKFEKLEKTLAEEYHLQPKLKDFTKGKACCCIHSRTRTNKWYRGQIESVEKDSACVFYVDYGYKESLSKDSIRECKLDWQKLPKMAVKFHISNLTKSATVSKAAYMKHLTNTLMENKFLAEILGRQEEILEVELLTEEGEIFTCKQAKNAE